MILVVFRAEFITCPVKTRNAVEVDADQAPWVQYFQRGMGFDFGCRLAG